MAIGHIEMQGSITRTQDFAQLRHAEDNKGIINQQQFTQNMAREVENRANSVNRGDDTNNNQKNFDAREKGSNEYYGDGGKNRKDAHPDGKVIVKGASSSFDVKI